MALYRLICACGHQSLVPVLTRCGLPLPVYFLADEKHSRALTSKVYLPTIVCGRVIWHFGYTEAASTTAFTQSYRAFQQAALQQEPSYRVRGILTDGFDSTTSSLRTLFPGARLGNCLRHALNKLPAKLVAIASPVRKALRSQFHTLLYRARQRKGLRVFALGQRLRRFADHVATTAGAANGERVRLWLKHYHERGLEGLPIHWAPGQPGRIPQTLISTIQEWVKAGPAGCGLDRAHWTYEELATYVYQTTGIAVKRTAMRDFCQRHDIRPYRPTYRYLRGDRYCWSTPFRVLGVRFLGAVCSAFLPSKKAYWAHQFQYLGVDQQCRVVFETPFHSYQTRHYGLAYTISY